MYGMQKSDELIVPMKRRTGKLGVCGGKGFKFGSSLCGDPTAGTQTEDRMIQQNPESDAMQRVKALAEANKNLVFNNLMHLATKELFRESFGKLNHHAVPGVDGVTWDEYLQNDLDEHLFQLRRRMFNGSYRALPSLRAYIPKPDGGQRPLGIASVEDKIAQTVVRVILEAVFEPIFKDFSYGFRPKRNAHQALDEVSVCIMRNRVIWILDADIKGYFDTIPHDLLVSAVERRVSDPRILRLIRKWLKAGIFDKGKLTDNVEGTPQGASISPLLANIYLHYVLDEWADEWRKTCKGYMFIVRYADDFILGFECKSEAERFLEDLKARLGGFGLQLHPDKTRLINFGKSALMYRRQNGLPKPETFDFLGFTHICATNKDGYFKLLRKTISKRLRRKTQELKGFLRSAMHVDIKYVLMSLNRRLQGYFVYFAFIDNLSSLCSMRFHLLQYWRKMIRRRSQKGHKSEEYKEFFDRIAPLVVMPHKFIRPYPDARTSEMILKGANARLGAGC